MLAGRCPARALMTIETPARPRAASAPGVRSFGMAGWLSFSCIGASAEITLRSEANQPSG
jgi:hypothetical protein